MKKEVVYHRKAQYFPAIKIHVGDIFKGWTVLGGKSAAMNGSIALSCRCMCGTVKSVRVRDLIDKHYHKCCLECDNKKRWKKLEKHYYSWTVLGPQRIHITPNGSRISQVLCRCVCGNESWCPVTGLRIGRTRQCKECARKYQRIARYGAKDAGKAFIPEKLGALKNNEEAIAWWKEHWGEVEPVLPYTLDRPKFKSWDILVENAGELDALADPSEV